jgi:hypothetical protein
LTGNFPSKAAAFAAAFRSSFCPYPFLALIKPRHYWLSASAAESRIREHYFQKVEGQVQEAFSQSNCMDQRPTWPRRRTALTFSTGPVMNSTGGLNVAPKLSRRLSLEFSADGLEQQSLKNQNSKPAGDNAVTPNPAQYLFSVSPLSTLSWRPSQPAEA